MCTNGWRRYGNVAAALGKPVNTAPHTHTHVRAQTCMCTHMYNAHEHICVCVCSNKVFGDLGPLPYLFRLRPKSLSDMVEMLLALVFGVIDSRDRLRDQTAEWMRSFMRVRIFGNFDPGNHRDPISLVSLVVVTREWCKRTTIVKMTSWWCVRILCVLMERLEYLQCCMETMERLD